MKKFLNILLLLMPFLTVAQTNFSVEGTGGGFKNGDKIYLVYKQVGKVVFDSTVVRSGTFHFYGKVIDISKGQIFKNENPMIVNEPTDELELIIEKGHIHIYAKGLLQNATVTGTANNIQFQQLDHALKPYLLKRVAISNKFYALPSTQQKDINNIADFRLQNKKLTRQMFPLQFQFIRTHPGSYISLITLKSLVNNKELLPGIDSAYLALSTAAKTSDIGKKIAAIITSLKKSEVGSSAFDFSLPGIDGTLISLSDFRGKYVLIDFWASWCLPCREENPNILIAYNNFKNKGFTVLGVSIENSNERKNWLKAIKEDQLPWTQVLDGDKPLDKIKTMYGVTTIPANVLIDPSGKIVGKDLKDRVLLNKLAELLGSPSAN